MSKSNILFSNERLFDLVRYCRTELHEANLINDEEYAGIASTGGSIERIQAYDNLRAENSKLRQQLTRLINAAASLSSNCGELPHLSAGGTAQAFLKGEIERAVRILDGKQPTRLDEDELEKAAKESKKLRQQLASSPDASTLEKIKAYLEGGKDTYSPRWLLAQAREKLIRHHIEATELRHQLAQKDVEIEQLKQECDADKGTEVRKDGTVVYEKLI